MKKELILWADDEIDLLKPHILFLKQKGYEVVTVSNGRDALEKAAEEIKNSEADLIVLDCIGYTQEMKKMFAEKTGKKVVLPRTLLARVVSELTDI